MQLLTHALGGSVAGASHKEYGPAIITHAARSPLFDGLPDELQVWMSHGDRIDETAARFPRRWHRLTIRASPPLAT